jgi:GntR family transcriptional regulator
MIMSGKYSRHTIAKTALLEMIRSMPRTGADLVNRLPTEDELARKLGVSVATVREALRMLEREGIISKRHGTGNFYHPSALDLSMRIDTNLDFTELLADGGYNVSQRCENISLRSADPEERELFGIEGKFLSYNWLYLADGRVAIHTVNLVPTRILDRPWDQIEVDSNILEFVWRCAGEKIAHANVAIEPRLAGPAELAAFGLSSPAPIITWNQTFYSFRDAAVGFVRVAFNPEVVKMQLLQKWA